MTGSLHEDQHTFMITSRPVLVRVTNISDIHCRENQNILCSVTFYLKSRCLRDNVEEYRRARQATDENMAHAHCIMDT
jgi:hypothetical protein